MIGASLLLLLAQHGEIAGAASPDMINKDTIYQFTMQSIEGKPVPLSKYQGKVLLVVNVASKCGMTPQYAKLQALYAGNKGKKFEVLGFPANDFGKQEPGTNAEIDEFCTKNYGVTFPMFSKIDVLGEGRHQLYSWLIAKSDRADEIEWNFAKFLVGKDGKVLARFSPKVAPDAPELVSAIDRALKA